MKMDITKLYDFSKAKVKCNNENNPSDVLNKRLVVIDIYVPKFSNDQDFLKIPKLIDRDFEI